MGGTTSTPAAASVPAPSDVSRFMSTLTQSASLSCVDLATRRQTTNLTLYPVFISMTNGRPYIWTAQGYLRGQGQVYGGPEIAPTVNTIGVGDKQWELFSPFAITVPQTRGGVESTDVACNIIAQVLG